MNYEQFFKHGGKINVKDTESSWDIDIYFNKERSKYVHIDKSDSSENTNSLSTYITYLRNLGPSYKITYIIPKTSIKGLR